MELMRSERLPVRLRGANVHVALMYAGSPWDIKGCVQLPLL